MPAREPPARRPRAAARRSRRDDGASRRGRTGCRSSPGRGSCANATPPRRARVRCRSRTSATTSSGSSPRTTSRSTPTRAGGGERLPGLRPRNSESRYVAITSALIRSRRCETTWRAGSTSACRPIAGRRGRSRAAAPRAAACSSPADRLEQQVLLDLRGGGRALGEPVDPSRERRGEPASCAAEVGDVAPRAAHPEAPRRTARGRRSTADTASRDARRSDRRGRSPRRRGRAPRCASPAASCRSRARRRSARAWTLTEPRSQARSRRPHSVLAPDERALVAQPTRQPGPRRVATGPRRPSRGSGSWARTAACSSCSRAAGLEPEFLRRAGRERAGTSPSASAWRPARYSARITWLVSCSRNGCSGRERACSRPTHSAWRPSASSASMYSSNGREPQLLEPADLGLREGLVGDILERPSAPLLQRGGERGRRFGEVAVGGEPPPALGVRSKRERSSASGATLRRYPPETVSSTSRPLPSARRSRRPASAGSSSPRARIRRATGPRSDGRSRWAGSDAAAAASEMRAAGHRRGSPADRFPHLQRPQDPELHR